MPNLVNTLFFFSVIQTFLSCVKTDFETASCDINPPAADLKNFPTFERLDALYTKLCTGRFQTIQAHTRSNPPEEEVTDQLTTETLMLLIMNNYLI